MRDLIIDAMFDTNELNRLQRCAKNKDKREIVKWARDFERRLSELYHERYKKHYLDEFEERLKDIDTALLYVLHFGESTRFGNKRLRGTMDDLSVVIKDMHNGQFNRNELREMLVKDKIKIEKDI